MKIKSFAVVLFLVVNFSAFGQVYSISGKITESTGNPVADVYIYLEGTSLSALSGDDGSWKMDNVPQGEYLLLAEHIGFSAYRKKILVNKNLDFTIQLDANSYILDELNITGRREIPVALTRLKDVEGTSIYAGKKTEVVNINPVTANVANNNSRQIYSRVAGLNIWESDGAGIQLGIGGRGLNPNRVSNFNTRQNGYDISADALGYPESYYTPPAEGLERVEIVRGASSLQYGTQFGGFVNFRMKRGPLDKKAEVTHRLTGGSFGFLNSFNSVGGTIGKVNYYSFYQYKRGNGWRPNSDFDVHTAYTSASWQATDEFRVTAEYTFMHYLAQQPGGLTDAQFARDPRQSFRARNWFKVKWNLFALMGEYQFNRRLKADTRFFGLYADRYALGYQGPAHRPDPGGPRDLLADEFRNIGNETRFVYEYRLGGMSSTALVGMRFYNGNTDRRQGLGTAGSDPDFSYVRPEDLEYSAFYFPNFNTAFFAENIIRVNSRLKFIPGIRYENIVTNATGYYNQVDRDLAGNLIRNARNDEDKKNARSFILLGAGATYAISPTTELYTNFSQNYRSINFNDIRVLNPNLRVDENLKDEDGYTFDIGVRGKKSGILTYEVTGFFIKYNNKIGPVLMADSITGPYLFRTNVSDARNMGLESYIEADVLRLIKGKKSRYKGSVFTNFSLIDAKYIGSKVSAYDGNYVEYAPSVILRSGILFGVSNFTSSFQYSYTSRQFSEATNAERTASGVNGIIHPYSIFDFTTSWQYKNFMIQGSINNITNNMYFTRRAEGYPGPGIIPSDGRSFFVTLQVKY